MIPSIIKSSINQGSKNKLKYLELRKLPIVNDSHNLNWSRRLDYLIDNQKSKRKILFLGQTKYLLDSLLNDGMNFDNRSIEILNQRYDYGGKFNNIIEFNFDNEFRRPNVKQIHLPLDYLKQHSFIEIIPNGLSFDEIIDELVKCTDLYFITKDGQLSDLLRFIKSSNSSNDIVVDNEDNINIEGLDEKDKVINLDTKSYLKGLNEFHEGNYNDYLKLINNSNINSLKTSIKDHVNNFDDLHFIKTQLTHILNENLQHNLNSLDATQKFINDTINLVNDYRDQLKFDEVIKNNEEHFNENLNTFINENLHWIKLPIKVNEINDLSENFIKLNLFNDTLMEDIIKYQVLYQQLKDHIVKISTDQLSEAPIISNKFNQSIHTSSSVNLMEIVHNVKSPLFLAGGLSHQLQISAEKSLSRFYSTLILSSILSYFSFFFDYLSLSSSVAALLFGSTLSISLLQRTWLKGLRNLRFNLGKAYQILNFDLQHFKSTTLSSSIYKHTNIVSQYNSHKSNINIDNIRSQLKFIENL